MARRRKLNVFGLSFLDAMTCGFGAVVLFFMVIQGATDAPPAEPLAEPAVDRRGEVDRLEEEVLSGHENLVELRNTRQQLEQQRLEAQGLSRRLIETLQQIQQELAQSEESTLAQRRHLNELKADLKNLEEDTRRLSASLPDDETPGDQPRAFVGDGDRQYLTGLKIGGERVLILVDASASMLADTLVNVIVRRNLPDPRRRLAPKWQRAVRTVDWLMTQMPKQSHFQLYTFAESVRALGAQSSSPGTLGPGSLGQWLPVADVAAQRRALDQLRLTAPIGGTNLHRALGVIKTLRPRPDNVILLVDGLPTQGRKSSRRGTISAKRRLDLFEQAIRDQMIEGLPVNVILFPMEGDPRAASAYWQLALASGGSFLAPAEDWP